MNLLLVKVRVISLNARVAIYIMYNIFQVKCLSKIFRLLHAYCLMNLLLVKVRIISLNARVAIYMYNIFQVKCLLVRFSACFMVEDSMQ